MSSHKCSVIQFFCEYGERLRCRVVFFRPGGQYKAAAPEPFARRGSMCLLFRRDAWNEQSKNISTSVVSETSFPRGRAARRKVDPLPHHQTDRSGGQKGIRRYNENARNGRKDDRGQEEVGQRVLCTDGSSEDPTSCEGRLRRTSGWAGR